MKKQILAGLLAGCIILSGCASMLERDYVSVTPHSSTKTDTGTSSVLRVENYQELVNSLIYFISNAAEEGVIRLYLDSAAVDEHLHNARLEILQEYPLAVYAVEDITYDTSPLVTYTEAHVGFSYRRTQQQVDSIVSANGISAIRNALTAVLTEFSNECVMSINYFDQDEVFINDLIQQAYYASPATALGFPEVEVHIYPTSGRQRIVEVLFYYQNDLASLSEQALLLEQACLHLAQNLPVSDSATSSAMSAAWAILEEGGHKADGGSTAYDALLSGGANHEGLALAMAAVCTNLDIPCKVARGLLDGQPHFWNVVYTDDGWRHIDLSQLSVLRGFYTDESWMVSDYQWPETSLPACG